MKLAYLVNTYPRASHTFIRREIQALERLGPPIHRFAMRSDRATLVDPADLDEDARTEHLLQAGAWALVTGAMGWMARHPRESLRALRQALRCGAAGAGGGPGTGGRLRHMVYLVEAAALAHRCAALGITHLHAHFGTNSTTVALLTQTLGGPGFSFTTHGPEEFDAPRALSLPEKLAQARFAVAISSYGHSQLCRVWQDNNFNPAAQAFYYTRVLENPSCRWSSYVCGAVMADCADPSSVPEDLRDCCRDTFSPVIQERAWSSPIWYMPAP